MATAYSVQLRPTAPATSVTKNAITLALGSSLEVGSHIGYGDEKYIVAPTGLTVDSMTPAWTGHKNGATVDCDGVTHGLDDRDTIGDGTGFGPGGFFDAGDRAEFPLTLAGSDTPRSLLCAESTADLSFHSVGIASAEVFTVLRSAPPRPTFRPPYVGTTKPLYTRADVNYGLLPGLDPTGITQPNWAASAMLRRLRLDIGPENSGRGAFAWGDWYPADDALYIGDCVLGALLDIPEARMLAERVIQYGIDMYAVATSDSTTFLANGGFGYGRLVPVVFAGMLLNHSGMKNAAALTIDRHGVSDYPKFGEPGYFYYGDPTVEYPGGRPLFGIPNPGSALSRNHILRDPDGVLFPHERQSPTGVCGSGSTTTAIVLDTAATGFEAGNGASDDYYNGYVLKIGGQLRVITDWVGATKTATVSPAFSGAPTAGTAWGICLAGTYMDYVSCVTGHALAIRILGAESVLGCNAFLDFIDYWVGAGAVFENYPSGLTEEQPFGTQLVADMWGAFR